MEPGDFVAALRGAAPYVHSHHGRTVVVAFPGETCARPDFERLLSDIALLSSLGLKVAIVHGARPQIDAELALRGLEPQYVGDLRVTDEAAMVAVKAAVGALRMDIEAKLSSNLAGTPMGGAQVKVVGGTWVTARPVGVRDGVDHLLTGAVRRIDLDAVQEALSAERIALLSPVGYSPTGEAFNLRNADVAEALAGGLHADKLVFVLESDPATWDLARSAGDAGHLLLSDAERFLASDEVLGQLSAEDRNCVRAALAACRSGVRRVHLVGAGSDGSLLRELYTRDGAGLMFYADEDYESTRDATIADVAGILALLRPLEQAGIVVPRSREQLELDVDGFSVMVRDGMVIACSALVPYDEDGAAEFAAVAVHPSYRGRDRAEALLKRAEVTARQRGLTRLFALTTHTPHWFVEHGFVRGGPQDLPAAKRAGYNERRNSLVLVKSL
ncbi:amino-acid N-acetyltransferase [Kineosporia sp. R_H_3]|uniref:amino-acid N-acetyltransferase n=1 Tax=Kineosporia sp. R_H_3 TaxID=1961848 RepID=UPI000B4A611B|nr:amino-acid N-acetyltransferase [Kineosporia sp. R_H_3]